MMTASWSVTYNFSASKAVWKIPDIRGNASNLSAVSRQLDEPCIIPFPFSCFVVETQVPFFEQRRIMC